MKSRHNMSSPLVAGRKSHTGGSRTSIRLATATTSWVLRAKSPAHFEHFGLHLTIEKNDTFLDPDLRVEEPVSGLQNTLEPLADLFIACDRLDVHLSGHPRKHFLIGGSPV